MRLRSDRITLDRQGVIEQIPQMADTALGGQTQLLVEIAVIQLSLIHI